MDSAAPRFSLGQLVITPGVQALLTADEILAAVRRHAAGDWGELDYDDRLENELSVREGFRILSAYKSPSGERFWVITEADRSVTTVLFPDEY